MTLEDIQLIMMLMWIALFIYDIALVHKLDRLEEKIDELKNQCSNDTEEQNNDD